jgi:hypothetical protein
MIWYVARTAGVIVAAFTYEQSGYATEALDDATDTELQAFLAPGIPQSITNAQLKRQLDADGRLAAVKAVVAQAGGLGEELWNGAALFLRNDPLLIQLATAAGMSSADIDQTFIDAAKIT